MKKHNIGVALTSFTLIIVSFIIGTFIVVTAKTEEDTVTKKSCTNKYININDNAKGTVVYSVDGNYTYQAEITKTDGDGSAKIVGNATLTSGNNVTVDYTTFNGEFSIKFTLQDKVTTVTENTPCGDVTFTYQYYSKVPENKVENKNYDSLCKDLRDDAASDSTKLSFYKDTLPYCFEKSVTYNYGKDELKSLIENVKSIWNIKNSNTSTTISTEGFKKVDSTDLSKQVLKCAVNSESNQEKYYYENPAVVGTYNGQEACRSVCTEKLTVTYGPPHAVKAGLCLTYTVEVQSKVECNTVYSNIKPKTYDLCTPIPYCNEVEGYQTQAGPNEKFESCINKCDGGKYTKKCSKQCYNKIYKNKTTTSTTNTSNMLNYANDILVTKTATACPNNGDINAINEYLKTSSAHYDKSGGTITWSNGGSSCWVDQYASFYFLPGIISRTVGDSSEVSGGNYYSDNDGFKRHGTSDSNRLCGNTCSYLGCTSDSDIVDPAEIAKKNAEEVKKFNDAINICKENAKCETSTQTSIFTMEINDIHKSGTDNWVKWVASNNTGSTASKCDSSSISGSCANIIKKTDGECYGGGQNPEYDYYTKINFPGSWINNKSHKVEYVKPKDTNAYTGGDDKYCFSPESKDVNVDWWKAYNDADTDITKISGSTKVESWNIKASAEKFGKFQWKLSLACFYGLYNGTCTGDNCCEGEDCSTSADNYEVKTSALSNILGIDKTSTDESELPYNWSCDATNLNNGDYKITPTATKAAIESAGNSIYDDANNDEYLDYRINLTPTIMQNIVNNDGLSYGEFLDSIDKVTIVQNTNKDDETAEFTTYVSNLLRNGVIKEGVVKMPDKEALVCNNLANSSTCQEFTDTCVQSWVEVKNALVEANKLKG